MDSRHKLVQVDFEGEWSMEEFIQYWETCKNESVRLRQVFEQAVQNKLVLEKGLDKIHFIA